MSVGITPPSFQWSFLLPKYWPVWIGAGLLYLLTWLPFSFILRLGNGVGWLLTKVAKKRVQVARRNLELCYPQWSNEQREIVLKKHLGRAGMAVFETAIGWWWPTWRIKKHFEIEGFEHAEAILKQGNGVFGLALHNMNLEFACRGLGYTHPSIAFYRKHNNPLMDYFQYHGRAQSNKYMIHKRNAKALLAAMDEGELCIYLPDQDYGRAQSAFVPFGGVEETATTTATLMFARRANCVPLMITSQYSKKGCKLKFYPPLRELADKEDNEALTELNQQILDIVNEQPESYLWMHKRFKTRPNEGDPSLY
ncbi:LpxL/LpxP family Kdo(2)-lipid IV(A) lauroyl/palmitoleoyl acyltransferase [Alteromonas sediminis]|uniref:Lipid A biosynthesis acyltransferase n=1 Tax=Alteromonas sediminis TaxID=2259342 RepID=A0A3N5XXU2_9ALTE|nr:LpxL/LpxP family Kdo(2)-lipid IV(A) lauroyl/palmitoleoyl acyltransferase [Alteromonas sediminis]RPJ65887.1 LpxL/LpxP family Kdo(2)-lipid IV(A) lauroyl/palmitoleoyl acyltransferase [Alteromonas sediminis]